MDRPRLIMLCGISGSGKTTYAKEYIAEHNNTTHLSSDAIRKELWGDESVQDNPVAVFELMQKRTIEALNEGQNVVYDSTALTRKDRASIISKLPKFVRVECHIIWAPIGTCIERDAARERTVGKDVIDRMLKKFQSPYYDENFDSIQVIMPDHFDSVAYMHECIDKMHIPHDNPHHTFDIWAHCEAAYDYIYYKKFVDNDLMRAALFHDMGKPYVKTFVNAKGEPCDTAHYYGHDSCGAWMSYGLPNANIFISWLISTHMQPFFNSKYYNNLPEFLKKQVDLLNEADLNAH